MKKGDTVKVIDENWIGVLTQIHGEMIGFEDAYGFEHQLHCSEVIVVSKEIDYLLKDELPKDRFELNKKNSIKQAKRLYTIDLHLDKIGYQIKKTEPWERFFIQKNHFLKHMELAKQKNYQHIEIIHGIGDGVLQKELYQWLKEMRHIDFDDNAFFRESSGSVKIRLYKN